MLMISFCGKEGNSIYVRFSKIIGLLRYMIFFIREPESLFCGQLGRDTAIYTLHLREGCPTCFKDAAQWLSMIEATDEIC